MLTTTSCVVLKIGSALLTDREGLLNSTWLEALIADVAQLLDEGRHVVIVSSGSVALGRETLGIESRQLKLVEKQAAAACGQMKLVEAYNNALASHGYHAAQILLTLEDTENRRRYMNAQNTLHALRKAGVVPIINENDSIATEEIRVGDNDRLAARVTQMVRADWLVLLSDVDGLYTENPQKKKTARHIPKVDVIDESIEAMAGGVSSAVGTGGMVTKIAAAKIAVASGCHTLIARGNLLHPIHALRNGARHTLFVAKETPMSARKKWIAHSLRPCGVITVDEGAEAALRRNKSLLSAGVVRIEGQFKRGDAVIIQNRQQQEIGRGLIAYDAMESRKIRGKRSDEIEMVLGYLGKSTLIHRGDLALSETGHPRSTSIEAAKPA